VVQIEVGAIRVKSPGRSASLGKVIRPSFARPEIPDVIEKLMSAISAARQRRERFIDVVPASRRTLQGIRICNADQRAAHRSRDKLASA